VADVGTDPEPRAPESDHEAAGRPAEFAAIERRIALKERRSFIRTLAAAGVVVAAAAVFLWITVARVEEAREEQRVLQEQSDKLKQENAALATQVETSSAALRDLETQIAAMQQEAEQFKQQAQDLQARLADTQRQLEETSAKLAAAAPFQDHVVDMNWELAKELASQCDGLGDLLARIGSYAQDERIHWGLQNTVEGGFTSPGFAAYVLREMGQALPENDPLGKLRRVTSAPRNGDLVTYDGGFTMFFFRHPDGRELVAGMTVVGIVTLEVDFGPKRLAVLRTGICRA
jgi:hypothetical protein